jgi:hypothetical protein
MKQQFVVAHTMRQAELPALPDSWVTNKTSVKMLRPQNPAYPHTLTKRNMLKCWSIQDLSSSLLSPVKLCISGLQVGRGTWHPGCAHCFGAVRHGGGQLPQTSYMEPHV